jgi:asparagine synthase (glutamine-hydrolysing)
MCGIFGIINEDKKLVSKQLIAKALSTLNRRGPDDSKIWISENEIVGFGHTRLSIQDLSSSGAQPMFSFDKKFIIIFNGEIYNHKFLRNKLNNEFKNMQWFSSSDTETLVNLFSQYGIDETLLMINGMFSIGLYDISQNKLFLIRDRMGEKPLYYSHQNNNLIFGSDLNFLKFFKIHGLSINRNSINELIKFSYISTPNTIYNNVNKLESGSYLCFNINSKSIIKKKYWSLKENFKNNYNHFSNLNENQIIIDLDKNLKNVVEDHLISDTEVGAFLSGGVDSSLIASYMQNISSKKIDTFTLGFKDNFYDESKNAKKISSFLGTNHHELIIDSKDALNCIEKIPTMYSEPFADSSQIPTFLVSKLAAKNVKVVLSGDGGDELFAGYNRYVVVRNIIEKPFLVKYFYKNLINLFSPSSWNYIFKFINFISLKNLNIKQPVDKLFKILNIIEQSNYKDCYTDLTTSHGYDNKLVLSNSNLTDNIIWNDLNFLQTNEEKMIFNDLSFYISDDIFCKVDRASMYNSLETRHPFMDQRIINQSFKIPFHLKIKNQTSKYLLKKILFSKIPQNLFAKGKNGFAVPIGAWLKGPLREWSNDLLNDSLIKNQGYFDPTKVRNIFENHLTGKENNQQILWSILMFQNWLINK